MSVLKRVKKVKNFVTKLSRRQKAISLFAVLALTGLGVAGFIAFQPDEQPASVQAAGLVTYSTDKPDESKENADNYNWQGAPDEPKKIRIGSLGVDAFVQKMGVDQNNQVAVPTNIHLTGWFVETRKPGQNGLSVIDGHVTGITSDGVFKHIGSLKAGDEFEVEVGSGETFKYRVLGVETKKADKAVSAIFSQNPKVKSQVNLVTCGGNFDTASNQYEDRVIVSGELIQ